MRKKQHKRINPKNKNFDKFYVINYLEYGKTWTDVQNETDDGSQEESDDKEIELMDCEVENLAFVCLFCDNNILDFEETLNHMKKNHNFDFLLLKEKYHLNFYAQIKLINYIRRKVYEKECINCDLKFNFHNELLKHMVESGHISILPDPAKWNQPLYYFSTFENDNLLCALDDDDDNSECQEEHLVYPEETVMPSSTLLYDENFRKNLI
ncbi:zinc finger protein 277-like isoform X1 [Stegodyphus dumicola]|uniref:zinc finger protein 277-like isoform X1 n=1 Tax=Stegodyphus dumicola TaxID=202533 RepID=UPI0015A915C9|nr:zinc finger protein 277-like isoform X1 [Stegodyphus dumicola]